MERKGSEGFQTYLEPLLANQSPQDARPHYEQVPTLGRDPAGVGSCLAELSTSTGQAMGEEATGKPRRAS